eukprot:g6380.t1
MPAGLRNLTVMLVPHSHDDTGWQRTVDQYYEEEVRYIYDTVVTELQKNEERRFIFVEVAYFMRWWREQDEPTRDATRALFARGQLEFVNGGWCMSDDASPTVDAQIDQVTLGHRYIADTLGAQYVPKIAWHIDPFGESSSYALWWKAMNFSTWVFNRIDTRLKDLWHNDTRLQFRWQPDGAGTNEGIFSHVLDTHYGAPEVNYQGQNYHFDYEVFGGLGGGESAGSQVPVSVARPSEFYNETADALAEAFAAMARLRAQWFKFGAAAQPGLPAGHGAILVPFGDDMKFQNAHKQFSNMDRLIARVNARFGQLGVHVRYSTLGEYFALLRGSAAMDNAYWPSYGSDFFPLGTNNNIYSDQPDLQKPGATEYWTGHYTTRPLMKSLAAWAGAAKHASEIALTLACARNGSRGLDLCGTAPPADLMLARDVTSVLQHHDSITGTSKQDVTADLDVRLHASARASARVVAAATIGAPGARAALPAGSPVAPGMRVALFNALGQRRVEHVTLPLGLGPAAPGAALAAAPRAFDAATGAEVPSAVIPAVPVASNVSSAGAEAQLVLRVVLPPLVTTVLELRGASEPVPTPARGGSARVGEWACDATRAAAVTIHGAAGELAATFSAATHRLSTLVVGGDSWSVEQQFSQYHSLPASNAYQFAPNRTAFPFGEPLAGKPSLCVLRSALLERAVQTYSNGTNGAVLRESVTAYASADIAALEVRSEFTMVKKDRELVTRYVTDLETATDAGAGFETDSNGHLMVARTTNATGWGRNASVFNVSMAVAGNYFPLSGAPGAIRVSERRAGSRGRALALLTDTAHGAASLQEGWLEVMLGRRCAEGIGIAVDDTDNVTSTTWLVPGATRAAAAAGHRQLAMRVATPAVPVVAPRGAAPAAPAAPRSTPDPLPANVHLLSLDRVALETTSPSAGAARVLLRLRHVFQQGESDGDKLSAPTTVDLRTLLPAPLALRDVVELPLNGVGAAAPIADATPVVLQPLQIRTFEATVVSM